MEEVNKIFETVLEQDEQILMSFKPNKKRMLLFTFLISKIFLFLLSIFLIVFGAVYYFNGSGSTYEDWVSGVGVSIGFGLLLLLVSVLYTLVPILMYKKTYYIVTNKKIVIRTGIIGIDYKTLDIDFIGSVNVNVNLYDKMMGKNVTGTISFASSSAPIVNNQYGIGGEVGGVSAKFSRYDCCGCGRRAYHAKHCSFHQNLAGKVGEYDNQTGQEGKT